MFVTAAVVSDRSMTSMSTLSRLLSRRNTTIWRTTIEHRHRPPLRTICNSNPRSSFKRRIHRSVSVALPFFVYKNLTDALLSRLQIQRYHRHLVHYRHRLPSSHPCNRPCHPLMKHQARLILLRCPAVPSTRTKMPYSSPAEHHRNCRRTMNLQWHP